MSDHASRGRAFAAALPVVPAVLFWYAAWFAAYFCFGLLFSSCEPDPTPRERFLADVGGPALIVLAAVVAGRLAGNPWPLAVVYAVGVTLIAALPIVIVVVALQALGLLFAPVVWVVVFAWAHDYWQAYREDVLPRDGAPGWLLSARVDRIVTGALVLLLLGGLVHVASLSGETESEREYRENREVRAAASATAYAQRLTPPATLDLRVATPVSSRTVAIDGDAVPVGGQAPGVLEELRFVGRTGGVVVLEIEQAAGADGDHGMVTLSREPDRFEVVGPSGTVLADLSPRLQVLPSEPIRLTLPDDGVYRLLYVRASADSPRLVLRLWSVDDIVVEAPVVDGPLTLTFTERNQVARIELEGQPGTEVRIAIGQPSDGAPEEWSQLLMLHPARGGQRQCDGRLMETPTACDLKFEGRGYLEIDSTTYFRQHPEATGAQLTLTFDWP